MVVVFLLLCCYTYASNCRWNVTTDGFWFDSNNWDRGIVPSQHSFAILPPQTVLLTAFVEFKVDITSLALSSNVELFFTDNSTLTVSDSLVMNGGSLSTDTSSPLSFSSVKSLIVDSVDPITFSSHKLIVCMIESFHCC
ncbi:hypothetical protein GEMRC1_008962 [Eukaryota sp. GEM-RC1]